MAGGGDATPEEQDAAELCGQLPALYDVMYESSLFMSDEEQRQFKHISDNIGALSMGLRNAACLARDNQWK